MRGAHSGASAHSGALRFALPQAVFYTLTVILVASFVLCAFVGHSFKTGSFPWVRQGLDGGQTGCLGSREVPRPMSCCCVSPSCACLPACSCGPSRCSRWPSPSSLRWVLGQ